MICKKCKRKIKKNEGHYGIGNEVYCLECGVQELKGLREMFSKDMRTLK